MRYLLDTDVIIDHLRRKESIESSVVEDCGVSIITFGELLYGAQKSERQSESVRIVKNFLDDFSIDTIPLDEEMMMVYAKVKAELETAGNIAEFDLLIASTAIVRGLSLVTRNKKHFERIASLRLY